MKKLFSLTLLALSISFASFAQVLPIFGLGGCCVGSGSSLFDSTTGGTWSSSNVAVGTVSTFGYVTGISAGTCTISYTVGTAFATYGYTVSPAPATIVGSTSVCVGATAVMTDAVSGGVWTSVTPTLASIGSASGVVTGIAAGSAQIEYSLGTGCYAIHNFTVGAAATPAGIAGSSTVCVGSTTALTDATPGGVWSSSAPATATVSSTGVVTGVSSGSVNITYTVTGACGSAYVLHAVSVTSTVTAGTISGATTVVAGSTTTLTDGVSGGTWTSSNISIATVGAGTGIVTGVSAGTVTITYTVTGCGGTAYTTSAMTVTPPPPVNRISGHVLFTGTPIDSLGTIKVWLIHYDPTTHLLTAVDSETIYGGGTSAYYQFTTSATTDSFRVKAAFYPLTFSTTGYIPTYHTAFFYWHDATTIYHTYPSADDNKDITMAYGTVTSGLGFIAGDVTTGANKGTSSDAPAPNMLVFVLNASGTVLQQTYTDATGHFSFSNLPVGTTYTIYPEDINYTTTSITGISLTTASPSMNSANFGQHVNPKTIRPKTTGIQNITSSVSSVIAFPNPSNGKLNIQWTETATEKGTVTIADMAGRSVYTSTININEGTGVNQVDISGLTDGIYMITVKSGTINYNSKIQLMH